MSVHQVIVDTPHLSDLDLARRLGRRLWQESELQLDFTGIESVTEEFATELCRTVIQQRDPALLHNALLIGTMVPPVQATFFSIRSFRLRSVVLFLPPRSPPRRMALKRLRSRPRTCAGRSIRSPLSTIFKRLTCNTSTPSRNLAIRLLRTGCRTKFGAVPCSGVSPIFS